MNTTLLSLLALTEQLKDIKIADDAKLILVVTPDPHMPAIVVEQSTTGERIFVQSANKERLCRTSYARDGGSLC